MCSVFVGTKEKRQYVGTPLHRECETCGCENVITYGPTEWKQERSCRPPTEAQKQEWREDDAQNGRAVSLQKLVHLPVEKFVRALRDARIAR